MTNVIILAAGLGSRLLPLTKDKPKSLIEFAGKSLLENQIELFRKNGIQDISIVTGYNKDKFSLKDINYFENLEYKQTSTLLSLFCAKQKIMNSDNPIPTTKDISRVFISEMVDRIMTKTHSILNTLHDGSVVENIMTKVSRFEKRMRLHTNNVQLKRNIAEYIFDQKKYPY